MPLRLLIALLPTLVSGCAVFAVADAAVTVVATTVKIGATVVETTVDVAAAGVDAVLGSDENEEKNEENGMGFRKGNSCRDNDDLTQRSSDEAFRRKSARTCIGNFRPATPLRPD